MLFFNVSAKLRRCAMLQAFMHATCVHVCIEVNVHVMQPTASVRLCVFFLYWKTAAPGVRLHWLRCMMSIWQPMWVPASVEQVVVLHKGDGYE